MKQYVLDSSAMLFYLRDAADAPKVARLFHEAQEGSANLAISTVNWAECRYILMRHRGAQAAESVLSKIAKALEIVVADREQAEAAADLKCRFSGSLADCFAATLAINRKATLVTSDPEFEAIKLELKMLRLLSH